ncbi:MAG: hypothetical protein LBD64_06095 [Odoribacteraceae bacterium]|jgi:hypothetical protein|nr:hypothetical protein [Odoribacteraceae bacterium]
MRNDLFQRSFFSRFRGRRGYGIHSPFAFDLIVNVIRERAGYYAFREIVVPEERERSRCQLLFRLAEREGYRRALLVGRGRELPARYLSAVSREMLLLDDGDGGSCWELFHAGRMEREPSREELDSWLERRDRDHSCALISDIRSNRSLWMHFRANARVSIEMSRDALLFFNPTLQPGHYLI